MKKWKILFFVALSLLVGSNVFWLYKTIDFGITYTYQQESWEGERIKNRILKDLIIKGGCDYSQKDILQLLRNQNPNAFIVEENNEIFIDSLGFSFDKNKLTEIK